MIIRVNDYIETAFSIEDAQKLANEIDRNIDKSEKITLDFSNIKFYTTLFFNNSVCKYLLKDGADNFKRKFDIINMSDVGQSTYNHSYDNAIEYFNLPADKRISQEQITSIFDDTGDN